MKLRRPPPSLVASLLLLDYLSPPAGNGPAGAGFPDGSPERTVVRTHPLCLSAEEIVAALEDVPGLEGIAIPAMRPGQRLPPAYLAQVRQHLHALAVRAGRAWDRRFDRFTARRAKRPAGMAS